MNIYERPTPRTDALIEKYVGGDNYKWSVMYGKLTEHAKRLEQELETCRDAHMANCLAADTLRREIHELRERLSGDNDER